MAKYNGQTGKIMWAKKVTDAGCVGINVDAFGNIIMNRKQATFSDIKFVWDDYINYTTFKKTFYSFNKSSQYFIRT